MLSKQYSQADILYEIWNAQTFLFTVTYCLKRSQALLTFCTVSMALLQTYNKQSSVTVSKNFRKWEGKLLVAASVYLYPFCFVGSIAMWGKPNYPRSSLFCQLFIIHSSFDKVKMLELLDYYAISMFMCSLICFCISIAAFHHVGHTESIWK